MASLPCLLTSAQRQQQRQEWSKGPFDGPCMPWKPVMTKELGRSPVMMVPATPMAATPSCYHSSLSDLSQEPRVVKIWKSTQLVAGLGLSEEVMRGWFGLENFHPDDADMQNCGGSEYWQGVATNVEYHIPECSISVVGCGHLASFSQEVYRKIPDLSIKVKAVRMISERNAEVLYALCGTMVEPGLPMFPLGEYVEWQCMSVLELNDDGKVQRDFMYFSLDSSVPLCSRMVRGLTESSRLLSSSQDGARLLQDALGMAGPAECATLLAPMRGRVISASQCKHGNHVLQAGIKVLRAQDVQFIVEELRGSARAVAEHPMQCRVLQRLLEHCPHQQLQGLIEELLMCTADLAQHAYGNFVVQRLLEHGTPEVRTCVAFQLCGNALNLARHPIASNVVRCALLHCPTAAKLQLLETLEPHFKTLTHHRHGSFVARELRTLRRNGALKPGTANGNRMQN